MIVRKQTQTETRATEPKHSGEAQSGNGLDSLDSCNVRNVLRRRRIEYIAREAKRGGARRGEARQASLSPRLLRTKKAGTLRKFSNRATTPSRRGIKKVRAHLPISTLSTNRELPRLRKPNQEEPALLQTDKSNNKNASMLYTRSRNAKERLTSLAASRRSWC